MVLDKSTNIDAQCHPLFTYSQAGVVDLCSDFEITFQITRKPLTFNYILKSEMEIKLFSCFIISDF